MPDADCAICNGSGYTLTESGRKLVEFIGRHLTTLEER